MSNITNNSETKRKRRETMLSKDYDWDNHWKELISVIITRIGASEFVRLANEHLREYDYTKHIELVKFPREERLKGIK
jgi:hypothetical protein